MTGGNEHKELQRPVWEVCSSSEFRGVSQLTTCPDSTITAKPAVLTFISTVRAALSMSLS